LDHQDVVVLFPILLRMTKCGVDVDAKNGEVLGDLALIVKWNQCGFIFCFSGWFVHCVPVVCD
jgi:hypothetical protein